MSRRDARRFLYLAMQDPAIRRQLNAAGGDSGRRAILQSHDISFTDQEFEDAWRHELAECQTEALADHLHDIRQWWQFLRDF